MAEPKVIGKVRATKDGGFYRAGRHWPKGWTDVKEGEFTDEQLKALHDEPMLVTAPPDPVDEPDEEPKPEPAKQPEKPKTEPAPEPKPAKAKAPAKEPEKPKTEEKQEGKGK